MIKTHPLYDSSSKLYIVSKPSKTHLHTSLVLFCLDFIDE